VSEWLSILPLLEQLGEERADLGDSPRRRRRGRRSDVHRFLDLVDRSAELGDALGHLRIDDQLRAEEGSADVIESCRGLLWLHTSCDLHPAYRRFCEAEACGFVGAQTARVSTRDRRHIPCCPAADMGRIFGGGRYVVGDAIGVGGMGIVYEAEDLVRTERVAIKVLHPDHSPTGTAADLMAQELRLGRAIHSPNVVAVLDGGTDHGRPFIAMQLVCGRPLDVVMRDDALSLDRVMAMFDQILAGLDAVHAAGYVHGDIKADNVLVDGSDRVTIIDLGLACEPNVARAGVISGTPEYLAPEVVRGGAKTVASDIYAVGTVLYELLTGTTPFGGGSVDEVLRRQVSDDVVPPSQRAPDLRLPLALENVVLRALASRPEARFASVNELREAIAVAMRTNPTDIVVVPRTFSTTTQTWTRVELPRRLAAGTRPPGMSSHQNLVQAALDSARTHIAAHRLASARDDLQAALDLVDGEREYAGESWRLLLALASVTERLRDRPRARHLARFALDSASRASSDLGRQRAKALLERLAA
jgi:serine/threonine protein kinase